MIFLDPAGREFYQEWDRAAQAVVADLRQAHGFDPEHPRLRRLVDTLTEHSAVFRRLWAEHSVRGKTQDAKRLLHPDVGTLSLTYQSFASATLRGSSSSSTTPSRAARRPTPWAYSARCTPVSGGRARPTRPGIELREPVGERNP